MVECEYVVEYEITGRNHEQRFSGRRLSRPVLETIERRFSARSDKAATKSSEDYQSILASFAERFYGENELPEVSITRLDKLKDLWLNPN